MARTYSLMVERGTAAPDFKLPAANPGVDGRALDRYTLNDFRDAEVLVVVFMCNHCPFVLHVEDVLLQIAREYRARGVAFVGISANDADAYPADAFDRMAERARVKQYPFPYLYDADQTVAKAYGAVCTPDFFVYGPDRALVYRGRMDETRPGTAPAHGRDLRHALDELLATGDVTGEQFPSIGCNIKWKPG